LDLAKREKLILSGLYLSKYDAGALAKLGFDGFTEAFNVIGYALGARPASVKNYRDEFDPLFPNRRAGWHKRPLREYCREVYEKYNHLDFETFTALIKSFFGLAQIESRNQPDSEERVGAIASTFAQRLVTGQAAERYFESAYLAIPEFQGCVLENTTQLGCGYDFCLRKESHWEDFFAVEVKGLNDSTGSISMTEKEFQIARSFRDRFFLFVAKNFRETPSHSLFRDPASCGLGFTKVERMVLQVSWSAKV